MPTRNSQNKDKSDRKGKKPKPSARLVPDLVGDQQNVDATELCKAWGKVRDQEVLVFFDPGARANFISPELASKLGIRAEEMGMTGEAGLACPGHSEAVTPILGKLRLHIQSYVDAEEFHIMPLQDCDVLLGIPWCYRLHAVVDTFHKKITLVHRGKTHVLDVKLKGESVPVVSASAISSVIKNHLFAYLAFAKEVHEVESNLSKLDKDRAAFLNGFSDCFSDSLPDELPPERPEDHRIDVVPGSSPPNRPPYRLPDISDAIQFVNSREKPLALYVFTKNEDLKSKVINETSSGAILVNDSVIHAGVHELPFGGVGNSGMGAYHGKYSFEAFSHMKPVLMRTTVGDVLVRYPPYTPTRQSILRRVVRFQYLEVLLVLLGLKS
ncbi:hypothetical protein L7F22_037389 [Adiantum nelumboides]|nr:hypothetical protein [Adiantum nelumboides]